MNQEAPQRFDAVMRDYYRAWFRYHPEAAVKAGVSGYAHLLTPFDEAAHAAVICLNHELRVALQEIDRRALDPERQLDMDLMQGAALLENRFLLEGLPQRPDPDRMLPLNALYQLLTHPVADFASVLLARLTATPAHLAAAGRYLEARAERIPAAWLQSAVRSAAEGVEFINDLRRHPKLQGVEVPGLDAAIQAATRAVSDYAQFLQRELAPKARGDAACGQAYFQAVLQHRHFLDVDAQELYAFGEELVAATERELKLAAHAVVGSDDIAAAGRRVQAQHPRPQELVSAYRTAMQTARAFVLERELITPPTRERLEVVETPAFLRPQIPFAAYSEPAPNDPAQQGYYYVTPPQDAAQLSEHSDAGIAITCVHEAWPGHHLQFVCANLNPVSASLPRLLNASASLYEGWALYCEQLMHEQGFLAHPAQKFLLLKDRLWRALRVLLDIDIHTRGMRLEVAAERLGKVLGFPPGQAAAEILWYSKAPTVPLSYATGWALINALRAQLGVQGPALKGFHDRLLVSGSIALPLAIRRGFGEPLWAAARRQVFPAGAYAAA